MKAVFDRKFKSVVVVEPAKAPKGRLRHLTFDDSGFEISKAPIMKRGTPDHPKVDRLCAVLRIPRYSAVGLLELLWHFTARYAPDGWVGRHSDKALARALSWGSDPKRLTDALVESGWLDRSDTHRLLVHDWHEHADQTVRRVLANRGLKMLTSSQHNASMMLASCYDKTSQPEPEPVPEPVPEPKAVTGSRDARIVSTPPNGIVHVASLLASLAKIYRKPEGEPSTHMEESTAAQLIRERGPAIDSELLEITTYRKKLPLEDIKFFPQSRSRLLEKWQETLDRARTTPTKHKQIAP